MRLNDLQTLPLPKLKILAEHFKLDTSGQRKTELAHEIMRTNLRCGGGVTARGVVEVVKDYAFLRLPENNYAAGADDVYVPQQIVRRSGLRTGDTVQAELRLPQGKERFLAVNRLLKINGQDAEGRRDEPEPFESQTPLYPDERLRLEVQSQNNVNMRVMDILTPIGKGQRGLIVAPPRTGKTVLLQMIANSISENNPEVKLIILLIDERPEEVTDMQRNTKAEVISSTFDEAPERHAQVSELVIEMAKRQVEQGRDVVILLDSITRLARAYNTTAPQSGRIMSGGIDANAMNKPKRFFGAARNLEGGGSLTIIATALIDTGSRMDEVIFEEFKGTGNMELNLDRALVDKRIFPAINIEKSGTRKEELLFHPDERERVNTLRKALSGIPPVEAMELLVGRMKKTKNNAEFLLTMKV
ncbi:MAG: transcription termination factor Rho [Kiritimatiellae bacterium]|nr:transcription termination factor Rho [Kiritimatiellia bacterium]